MTSLLTKLTPMLNKAIPASLAIKGMQKTSPKMSQFVTTALTSGYTADNILDFMRESITSTGRQKEEQRIQQKAQTGTLTPEEKKAFGKQQKAEQGQKLLSAGIGIGTAALTGGPIAAGLETASQLASAGEDSQEQQLSFSNLAPNTYKFVTEKIQQGKTTDEAGALAQLMGGTYQREISRLENKFNTQFSNILAQEFGDAGQQAGMEGNQEGIQQPGAAIQGAQGTSQGDEALMAAMQNLKNILG